MTRNRTLWAAAVAAVLVVATGGSFLLGRTTVESSSSSEAVAVVAADETIAVSGVDSDGPVTGLADFHGQTVCIGPVPAFLSSDGLDPKLGGFAARYLSSKFRLGSIAFGASCRSAGGRVIETNWIHVESGSRVSVRQEETGQATVPERRPGSLVFGDAGFEFFVWVLGEYGGPMLTDDPGAAEASLLLDEILVELAPNFRAACFAATVSKTWDDLAAYGIGDPRPAMPAGIVPIRLEFTVEEPPASDCPAVPERPGPRPTVVLSAMFVDRNDNMVSVHYSSPKFGPSRPATFQSGSASWPGEDGWFSFNWRPGLMSDDVAKSIALALDPSYGSVCTVNFRKLDADGIAAAGFRVPELPPSLKFESGSEGNTFVIEPGPDCPPDVGTGFQAQWLFSSSDLPGVLQVTIRQGAEDPRFGGVAYDPNRTIYWRDARGAEYWIDGFKAIFERGVLMDLAKRVDPNFEESQLTTPPAP